MDKAQLLALFLFAVPGAHALGQSVDTLNLQTVQVVARQPYADLIPAQKLDGQTLKGLNSHSVADAMRYFSGVQVKDYGGIGGVKTIDMRSMGTNHMGIFYDGIQLGNAQNGQIDLGKFSLDNIESITMYNGQRSEIFQSAKDFGSSGTAYIQSRRPHFTDRETYHLRLSMRTGSFGLANPSISLDNKLSSTVSSTLSAEYTYATGKYKFRYRRKLPNGSLAWDTTATRQNGDLNAYRLEGGLYGQLPRNGYWQAKAYYYDSERGIPGAIVNNVWKNSQHQWDRNFFIQARSRYSFSRRYALQLNAKYARDYMRYLNPDTTLMWTDHKFYQDEIYVSAANRFLILPGFTANLSTDYQWNKLRATIPEFSYPHRHTFMGAVAAAYQWRWWKIQASLLNTSVWDYAHLRGSKHSSSLSRWTPAVFASYNPFADDRLSFRAFFKKAFRMPTFNDLFYTDIGNAQLKPEMATQYNVGATFHRDLRQGFFSSFELKADAYYNHVRDKIIAVPKGTGQYRWMMMNLGRVRIRGLDLSAAMTFEPWSLWFITLRGNYTYQRAQDYTHPDDNLDEAGTYKGQIAYIPRHSASATVAINYKRAQLNYSFIYVGERYHNSSNIRRNYEPPWYTSDLSLSYRQPLGITSLSLTLEVNNLLNQQYEVIQNYPMPGRNFKIIASFEI